MQLLSSNQNVYLVIAALFTLAACGSGSSSSPSVPEVSTSTSTVPVQTSDALIKVNQIGYLPSLTKQAIVPATATTEFEVVNTETDSVVFSGSLSAAASWLPAAEEVKIADFSALSASGSYVIQVEGFANSPEFSIAENSLLSLHDGALKAYYFNRASLELTTEFAQNWARPLGHPDDQVLVHASAASAQRPAGTIVSSTKGWYDAGDFNKYVVNSGISTYTLMLAYQQHQSFYQTRDGNIPESDNNVPDILDEIMWNLEWLQTMQDPNDGGVYHKLTTKNFAGTIMPHQATEQRYLVQKGTGAALNFAAVMARASQIYKDIPELDQTAEAFKQAAIVAFEWATANPNLPYQQPDDIQTGIYGDTDFAGEFAWASAELHLVTQEAQYLTLFNQYAGVPTVPFWQDTMSLGYVSLVADGKNLLPTQDYAQAQSALIALADNIEQMHQQSAYKTAMQNSDFVWGSNSVALNKAFIVLQAYKNSADTKYLEAAIGLTDYVLGKNPLDYSYVTGFGRKSPMDPHHRQSFADPVDAPVPGFLVGGPHTGRQDGCTYQGNKAATTYVDDWCSYATNEVTINWNAPLVYVLAAMHQAQ